MGAMQVLATMRKKYWVIGDAATVRKKILDCVVCRKAKKRMQAQNMADFPPSRS